jgi:hypothetical protein
MSDVTLSKTETALLVAAASAGGLLVIPDATKPATRTRLMGRLERDALIATDEAGHRLTPAGYRAVGLRPPRRKCAATQTEAAAARGEPSNAGPPGTKQALVAELLGRGEGASVPELMEATGWLPHTTRAALSRLRSSGRELTRSKREDGATAYRILPPEPAPARRARKARREADAEAAV